MWKGQVDTQGFFEAFWLKVSMDPSPRKPINSRTNAVECLQYSVEVWETQVKVSF